MTERERLVKFLKAMREELLRVREWSAHDVGLCTTAKKVYKERFVRYLAPDSDLRNSDLEPEHIIQYLHIRYKIEDSTEGFWWPIAVTSKDSNEPWAGEGRQSRLAFLDQAIADLEAEIKEDL